MQFFIILWSLNKDWANGGIWMLKYIWEGGRTHWTNGWGMHADVGAALNSRKPFYIGKEVIKNSQKNHDNWIMVVRIICCINCGLETISYDKEEDDSWLMFWLHFIHYSKLLNIWLQLYGLVD